ncbi:hypothetical protein DBZ36_04020 [Alginatibacterium sediminis]|uniref:WbqC family protein n=1 Tax=Alginatibacterium sediminis TaxID=2164068 RepID=A0A420EG06_9ALTE|nr:WbqC family protein [Alginatibacterium sediminis]RKF19642.1 hypothetical protein DBZ36_04020 [Alginatibacterium sediminis]
MKIAIMQPYFLPYIGYFQLIKAVDTFVLYDDIQYTKKGWINRNRLSCKDGEVAISLPIKKDSDYLNVNQRFISEAWNQERTKLLRKIDAWYSKSPFFTQVYPLLERILLDDSRNLFDFIYSSLKVLIEFLGISTSIIKSSSLLLDNDLKGQSKVLQICEELNALTYVNPQGGVDMYRRGNFEAKGLKLEFLFSQAEPYDQLSSSFIPYLSIVDVLMFNDLETVNTMLNEQYLIKQAI